MYKKQCKQFALYMGLFPLTGCASGSWVENLVKEESVGAFTARVILFGTIPTTIPSTVPNVDSPTIPHIAPTIQYTSSFVCTDSSDSDTPDTSPSQDPYEVTVARLSRKRCRSPTTLVPEASSVPRALSPVRFDLLPPRKRIKDNDFVIDPDEAESSARGTIEIGVDRVTHLVVSDDAAEPVRDDYPDLICVDGSLEVMQRGLDMVMQELYDHMVEIQVHRVRVIESVQKGPGT
nr:hypothetical protein [Tanacetum cinerariifolium]